MSSEINIHGLKREIPADVKRRVRKECGFGCVCCGMAIATYEHIDPLFKDAKEHDHSKIAFLCGGCHDRVTRGVWSKQKVIDGRKNPWCLTNGKCHDSFDISTPDPVIWAGPNRFEKIKNILSIDDEVLLSIDPADCPGEPFSISGKFYDESGNLLFEIKRNEWIGNVENWDIETVGPTIIIRIGPGKISLRITALPPFGIAIEKASMFFKHARFQVNEYQARLLTWNDSGVTFRGRRIEGYDSSATLLVAYKNGTCNVGNGEGEFLIGPPPTDPPEFVKKRAMIKRNSKCICGSALIFKNCCESKGNGKPKPGKGPMLTFEGIPFLL